MDTLLTPLKSPLKGFFCKDLTMQILPGNIANKRRGIYSILNLYFLLIKQLCYDIWGHPSE